MANPTRRTNTGASVLDDGRQDPRTRSQGCRAVGVLSTPVLQVSLEGALSAEAASNERVKGTRVSRKCRVAVLCGPGLFQGSVMARGAPNHGVPVVVLNQQKQGWCGRGSEGLKGPGGRGAGTQAAGAVRECSAPSGHTKALPKASSQTRQQEVKGDGLIRTLGEAMSMTGYDPLPSFQTWEPSSKGECRSCEEETAAGMDNNKTPARSPKGSLAISSGKTPRHFKPGLDTRSLVRHHSTVSCEHSSSRWPADQGRPGPGLAHSGPPGFIPPQPLFLSM